MRKSNLFVAEARKRVVVSIGQLSRTDRAALDYAVKIGFLVKWRGYWYPVAGAAYGVGPLKTCWGTERLRSAIEGASRREAIVNAWKAIPCRRGARDVFRVAKGDGEEIQVLNTPRGAPAFFYLRDRAVYAAHMLNNAEKRRLCASSERRARA
jgi:hypothetical protein